MMVKRRLDDPGSHHEESRGAFKDFLLSLEN